MVVEIIERSQKFANPPILMNQVLFASVREFRNALCAFLPRPLFQSESCGLTKAQGRMQNVSTLLVHLSHLTWGALGVLRIIDVTACCQPVECVGQAVSSNFSEWSDSTFVRLHSVSTSGGEEVTRRGHAILTYYCRTVHVMDKIPSS